MVSWTKYFDKTRLKRSPNVCICCTYSIFLCYLDNRGRIERKAELWNTLLAMETEQLGNEDDIAILETPTSDWQHLWQG